MSNDILLLLIGSLIGFLSALLLEYIKDKRELKRREMQNRENHLKLQTQDALELLEKANQVSEDNTSSLAWLRVVLFMGDGKSESDYVQTRSVNDQQTRPVNGQKKLSKESKFKVKLRKMLDKRPKKHPDSGLSLDHPSKINFGLLEFADNKEWEIQGTKFLLKKSNIIGRGSDCDISLPFDRLISRKHLLIMNDGNIFSLFNLSPRNGTWINDYNIADNQRHELNHGDQILIGDILLQFETTATKVIDKDISETFTKRMGSG